MGAIATFFVISKPRFEEYCRLASVSNPLPTSKIKPSIRITRVTKKGPAKKQLQVRQKLQSFLKDHGQQPYKYSWNGFRLADLLSWLQQSKNIDMCQTQFQDATGLSWFVFDEVLKARYLEKLNPANFEPHALAKSYHESQQSDEFKDMASALEAELNAHGLDMFVGAADIDPEQGEAMMDGIKIICDYLRLIDSHSVVMLTIDY